MTDNQTSEPWKTRRMIGGRWQDPEADGEVPKRVDKPISVKMTEAELAEFDAQIAVLGLKRNRALRIAARRIGGFVETDAETLAELREIRAQLTGIARNVNQIARSANRTHDPDYQAFMAMREGLGREFGRLGGRLSHILDVGTRRSDGVERLTKAAGQAAE